MKSENGKEIKVGDTVKIRYKVFDYTYQTSVPAGEEYEVTSLEKLTEYLEYLKKDVASSDVNIEDIVK